jgi:hypothetical protein
MKFAGSLVLLWMLVVGLGIIGEVQCIIKAIDSDWKSPYKREVVYTISVLTGVGALVGWLNIKDN